MHQCSLFQYIESEVHPIGIYHEEKAVSWAFLISLVTKLQIDFSLEYIGSDNSKIICWGPSLSSTLPCQMLVVAWEYLPAQRVSRLTTLSGPKRKRKKRTKKRRRRVEGSNDATHSPRTFLLVLYEYRKSHHHSADEIIFSRLFGHSHPSSKIVSLEDTLGRHRNPFLDIIVISSTRTTITT